MTPSNLIIKEKIVQSGEWIGHAKKISQNFVILTNHTLKKLWGHELQQQLIHADCKAELFSIPAGEKYKNRRTKEKLEDRMFQAGVDKTSSIIALGGGVITDLAGFVAATFCRGLSLISIPTTLLAQVDAAVGGKVAVNTPYGKNLIGTFHNPSFIFIDPSLLSTLSQKELLNGMAEIIKYGLIDSFSLFEKLEFSFFDNLQEKIDTCCQIKLKIVEKDPKENGLRRILNFGHTIGHAIESATNYSLAHGQAVGLGILGESHLSFKAGFLKKEEFERIETVIRNSGIDLKLPESLSTEALQSHMKRDKKNQNQQTRFVLLESIGKPLCFQEAYCSELPNQLIEESLKWLLSK